jgi:ceramide glucosyltransferase
MAAHTLTAWQWVLLAGCGAASLYAMLAAIAMPFFARRYPAHLPGRHSLKALAAVRIVSRAQFDVDAERTAAELVVVDRLAPSVPCWIA